MGGYKPVDTAIVMVVGPVVDNTDFKTLEEAIAYNAAGMDVSLIVEKTNGTTAVTAITLTTAGSNDWLHRDGGYYSVEVTAAQNTEEGIGYVRGICTGVLAFESAHYDVVPTHIYDSIVKGTDKLEVDTIQMSNSAQSLLDLKDFADTGYNPTTHKTQGVVLVDTTTTNTDMVGTNGANTVVPDAAGVAPTVGEIRTEMEGAGTKLTEVLTDTTGLNGAAMRGTDGANTTVPDAAGVAPTAVEIRQEIDTNSTDLNSILGDTNELQINQGNWLTATGFNTVVPDAAGVGPTAAENADAVWNEAISGHVGANTFGAKNQKVVPSETINDYKATGFNTVVPDAAGVIPTAVEIRQEMDTNSTDLNSILGDTNELQTNQGNWLTATGFSTHNAAAIWSVGTRALTDKAGFSLSTSGIKAIWDQATNVLTTVGSIGKLLVDNINATISSRNSVTPDVAGTLATYDPPTRTEATADKDDIIADLLTMKQKVAGTYNRETDSMEAIRDRGDTAWITGGGGAAPTVVEIRQEMDTNSTEFGAIITHINDVKGTGFIKDTHSLPQCLTGGTSPTVEQIRTEMDDNSTKLESIDKDLNNHDKLMKALLFGGV